MYSNLSFTTSGEFFPSYGVLNSISSNSINLSTYDKLDELRIAAVKFKLQYLLDFIDPSDIFFDVMPSEQRNMISQLYYGNRICGVINMDNATAKKRMDSDVVRFEDPSEGYVAILHAMIRKGLIETPPIELVLGQIHSVAVKFMYTTIIRSFDKYYNLLDKKEEDLSKIRYACAYVTACKMFKLDVPPNDVAIPLTQLIYTRVDPKHYVTTEDLSTYKNMVKYLSDSGVLEGLNTGAFVEAFLRQLGNRSLVTTDCGVDFVADVLLSKSVGRLIPRNLYRLVGDKECQRIGNYITSTFNSSKKVKVEIPAIYTSRPEFNPNQPDTNNDNSDNDDQNYYKKKPKTLNPDDYTAIANLNPDM